MIILDDEGHPGKPAAGSEEPLSSRSALDEPSPPYVPHESDSLIPKANTRRFTPRIRACFQPAVCFCVCLALSAVAILSWRVYNKSPTIPGGPPILDPPWRDRDPGTCSAASTWPEQVKPYPGDPLHYSDIVITLPETTPPEALHIQAVGKLGNGTVHVRISGGYHSEHVRIGVRAAHTVKSTLDHVNLCLGNNQEGPSGILLYSPSPDQVGTEADSVIYDIDVTLPNNVYRDGPLTYYPKLIIDVPRFNVSLHDAQNAKFGIIAVNTQSGSIDAEHLMADTIDLDASGGAIGGSYSATTALIIRTVDAGIDVIANLTHTLGSKSDPTAQIQSLHSSINASISAFSEHPPSAGSGFFTVHATALEGNVAFAMPIMPLNSALALTATSRGAAYRASANLPAEFEGTFVVRSAREDGVGVKVRNDVPDPAGQGRKRAVDMSVREGGRVLQGFMRWERVKREVGARRQSSMVLQAEGQATLVS